MLYHASKTKDNFLNILQLKLKIEQLEKLECEKREMQIKSDQERKDMISVMDHFKVSP